MDEDIEPTTQLERDNEARWTAPKLMGLLFGTMVFALAVILISAELVVRANGT